MRLMHAYTVVELSKIKCSLPNVTYYNVLLKKKTGAHLDEVV
jgi:hypothetical protein